jgi:hypothetical protein
MPERQPERASAVRHDDDAPRGPDHASDADLDWVLDYQVTEDIRNMASMTPLYFLQTHFPEEDGFQHLKGPFGRELCYTQKTKDGEEVAVTVPEDDTWVFQAAKRGDLRARVDGIRQGGAVCLALSMLPPEFPGSEAEPADTSDAAFLAAKQALLDMFKKLQNPNFEGSKPVPDEWLEGCLSMVCVGNRIGIYEYSKTEGLCEPQANKGWMLLKLDEEIRRKSGLPPQPLLRDAESLSKSTNSQSNAHFIPGRIDFEGNRELFADGFPGVATREEFLQNYFEHQNAKTADHHTSLYSLRKRALELPLAAFQSAFPKEDGFHHQFVGPLKRDLHYTELTDGGEKVAVKIPWDNTGIYFVMDNRKPGGGVKAFALCALPPASVASSEANNAETAWGRGISDATMMAVSQELEHVIKQFQGPGYGVIPPATGIQENCLALAVVGLEMRVGSYSEEVGVRWFVRGPVVEDGYGLAAASDPSHWRLPPRP